MRTITTAPGIGDFLWVLMKLINQKEKFDFVFPVRDAAEGNRANVQTRAFQISSLLPQLINTTIHKHMKFDRAVRGGSPQYWADVKDRQEFILEANSHLEDGKRIETFLPDLETRFILPLETTKENKKEAEEILRSFKGKKICGIYTSNHAKTRESWLEEEWVEMINLIKNYDPDYKFVFIGADYDRPLLEGVASHFDGAKCIDRELGTVIEVLKKLDIFISFQSGLSIIGELIGIKQTVMLYWSDHKHKNIIEAWPDPERIASGRYKGCVFCPPEQLFDWLVENNKL